MLPYAAMQSVIDDELNSNVALERIDTGECPVCTGAWRTRCPACDPPRHSSPGPDSGPTVSAADPPAAESDAEALLRAVCVETSGADSRTEYLVGCLDRHGLLDRSCEQLAAELQVDVSAVARVADVIRQVVPPGVGATSIAESLSLLLQLDALGLEGETAKVARAVIRDHLGALAQGHLMSIAAALGVTRPRVAKAAATQCASLRGCSWPGNNAGNTTQRECRSSRRGSNPCSHKRGLRGRDRRPGGLRATLFDTLLKIPNVSDVALTSPFGRSRAAARSRSNIFCNV